MNAHIEIKYLRSSVQRKALPILYRYKALTTGQLCTFLINGKPTARQLRLLDEQMSETTSKRLTYNHSRSIYSLTPAAKEAISADNPQYPRPRPLDLTIPAQNAITQQIKANQCVVRLVQERSTYGYLDHHASWGMWSSLQIPKISPLKPDNFLILRTHDTRTLTYLTYSQEKDVAKITGLLRAWRVALQTRAESVGGAYAQDKTPCPAAIVILENDTLVNKVKRTMKYVPQQGPYIVSASRWRENPWQAMLYPAGHDARKYEACDLTDIPYWHGTTLKAPIYPVHTPDPYDLGLKD